MTLKEVCESIALPEAMTEKVLALEPTLDLEKITPCLDGFSRRSCWDQTLSDLNSLLGEDPDGSKILTVMLLCAAKSHDYYAEKGISEQIFSDTMRFCTRFIQNHFDVFGEYAFRWAWWFPRELSLQEFRIGALEYEMLETETERLVHIHIPADADLHMSSVLQSLTAAKSFLREYFPAFADAKMVCDSWLLSPTLSSLLPERSNIRDFQSLFTLLHISENGNGGIQWLYGRTDLPYPDLPEKTSLQKKAKQLLLSGGHLGEAFGELREDLL